MPLKLYQAALSFHSKGVGISKPKKKPGLVTGLNPTKLTAANIAITTNRLPCCRVRRVNKGRAIAALKSIKVYAPAREPDLGYKSDSDDLDSDDSDEEFNILIEYANDNNIE